VPLRPLALALIVLAGCDGATGSVSGGEALVSEPDSGGGTTFTSLYADYFGPSAPTGCTAQTTCHGTASQNGAVISGFVCGSSKDECWMSMTQPSDADFFPPIVTPGFTDPTTTGLYKCLHQPSSSTDNSICSHSAFSSACNMPCGDPPTCTVGASAYAFTSDDLARITTWMQQGAQNN
jgi:hypothetical protein